MSRRRAAEKRQVLPDPIYSSIVLNKFINEVRKIIFQLLEEEKN